MRSDCSTLNARAFGFAAGVVAAFGPAERVTFRSQRFATMIVDVGSGPKVYDRGARYPIDFIPQSDPARGTAGDTLGFRLVLDGHPLSGLSIHATVAPKTGLASGRRHQALTRDSGCPQEGIVP